MDPQTQSEFKKLLSIKENNRCIDCDSFNPKWASVNNGCMLCIKCAGNHRSMGVHISFVRSITMDKWSKIQLLKMKNGGNHKLKQFWQNQKFPKDLSPKERVDNDAMDKYRNNLLENAKGKTTKPIGFIGYQKRVIQQKNIDNKSLKGFGNTDYNPTNNKSNFDLLSTAVYGLIGSVIAYYIYHVLTKK
eukprot:370357_1